MHHVYAGNVRDREAESRWCPGCGELLIARDGYQLVRYILDGNCCGRCGRAIAGIFDPTPGRWGAHRMPVILGDGPAAA